MDAAIGTKREELAIAGHEVLGPRHDSTFENPIGRVRDDRESRRAGSTTLTGRAAMATVMRPRTRRNFDPARAVATSFAKRHGRQGTDRDGVPA